MFVYLFIAVAVALLYIPLSIMWSGSGTGAGVCDDPDDDRLPQIDTIEDAFRFNRAGGYMSTDGMGDRPLE